MEMAGLRPDATFSLGEEPFSENAVSRKTRNPKIICDRIRKKEHTRNRGGIRNEKE